LYIQKCIFAVLFVLSSLVYADNGWVSVSRPERVVHQLEEEDHSIWVVFAKSFGTERVLVRFPEDPHYRHAAGYFEASATHLGSGEMTLIVCKKNFAASQNLPDREVVYRDADTGRWVFERHIETDEYQYVLRFSHPSQSKVQSRQFFDSFEIVQN
jgi:hypothetical protein